MHDVGGTRIVEWFEGLWIAPSQAALEEFVSPEAEIHLEGISQGPSREEMRGYHQALVSAVSGLDMVVEDLTADGETMVLRWRLAGVHDGPGLGVPPTGRAFSLRGITWLVLSGDMIVERWDRWNRARLLLELTHPEVRDLRRRFGLTPRQSEVAQLMVMRLTHKEIAKQLDIRPNTARRHCEQVLKRLGIRKRESVAAAIGIQTLSRLPFHGSDLAPENG